MSCHTHTLLSNRKEFVTSASSNTEKINFRHFSKHCTLYSHFVWYIVQPTESHIGNETTEKELECHNGCRTLDRLLTSELQKTRGQDQFFFPQNRNKTLQGPSLYYSSSVSTINRGHLMRFFLIYDANVVLKILLSFGSSS